MRGVPKNIQRSVLLSTVILFPLFLIGGSAILIQRSQREFQESTRWVNHTLQVLTHAQSLRRHFVNAETGHRAFVLSGNPIFLELYEPAPAEVRAELQNLRSLTVDNSRQQQTLDQLEPILTQNLERWAHAVANRKQSTAPTTPGENLSTTNLPAILQKFASLQQEETQLLRVRQDKVAHHFAVNTRIAVFLLLANLLVAGGVLFLWRRLSAAQNLVTVCAWSKTIRYEDEWLTFEEYLRRRFNIQISHGVSPAEADRLARQLQEIEGTNNSPS